MLVNLVCVADENSIGTSLQYVEEEWVMLVPQVNQGSDSVQQLS